MWLRIARVAVVWAGLGSLATSRVSAQDCRSRYCFALAFVRSLSDAHFAYMQWPDSGLGGCIDGGTVQGGASGVIYNARAREEQLRTAGRDLDAFRAVPDSTIQHTITFLDDAFLIHSRLARKIARYCRALADGTIPPGFDTPSKMADSAAADRLAADLALKALAAAGGELGTGLSALDPRTKKLTVLLLTPQQRDDILGALRKAFGAAIAQGKPLETDFADGAMMFYQWLSDPQWRPTGN